jgi:hypothetical protein
LNICSDFLPDLPADRLDLLKRTMPGHGLFPRPVDLFENEPANMWLLSDSRRSPRRDIVALYNWGDQSLTIDVALDRIGLPGGDVYVGFDYWANGFIAPLRDRLHATLPPQSCQILALRPLLDRPFLVSTSRHITQGIVDVKEETWDGVKTLSGISEVVANDPYELRVFAPTGQSGWRVDKAEVATVDRDQGAEITFTQSGPEVRATIRAPFSRPVHWRTFFERNSAR